MTAGHCQSSMGEQKTSIQLLFQKNLLDFLGNVDSPRWDASLNLFDSLTRIVAIIEPESEAKYHNLLLRFLWDETSVCDVQRDANSLLGHCPHLREHFAGFLDAPLKSKVQEVAARQYLCALTGLPMSVMVQPSPRAHKKRKVKFSRLA